MQISYSNNRLGHSNKRYVFTYNYTFYSIYFYKKTFHITRGFKYIKIRKNQYKKGFIDKVHRMLFSKDLSVQQLGLNILFKNTKHNKIKDFIKN